MATNGFVKTIWEEDLRALVRDLINQLFYLIVTVGLDTVSHLLLDRSVVSPWLRTIIYQVFEFMTLAALAQLAIPMTLRMFRSTLRPFSKAKAKAV